MALYYLIYTSIPARPMNDAELIELLDLSRAANSRFEITGMLICLPETFIQLIEGPGAAIGQLYRNIYQDKRHFRVTTLHEGTIDHRFFPDWAMAFKKAELQGLDEQAVSLQDEKVFRLFDIIES